MVLAFYGLTSWDVCLRKIQVSEIFGTKSLSDLKVSSLIEDSLY